MCARTVPLPSVEPWLIVDGERRPPALVSFRCPHCRRRIYINSANEADRERDETADSLHDEEDEE